MSRNAMNDLIHKDNLKEERLDEIRAEMMERRAYLKRNAHQYSPECGCDICDPEEQEAE